MSQSLFKIITKRFVHIIVFDSYREFFSLHNRENHGYCKIHKSGERQVICTTILFLGFPNYKNPLYYNNCPLNWIKKNYSPGPYR